VAVDLQLVDDLELVKADAGRGGVGERVDSRVVDRCVEQR
jgi:hypothetical protein